MQKPEKIKLSNNLTSIGSQSFFSCSSLTEITIPDNVTYIEGWAFERCSSLNTIILPRSLTDIGLQVFEDCTSLQTIDVDVENQKYCSEDGVLFNKAKTTLICFPAGRAGAYQIPAGVQRIDPSAFEAAYGLTAVAIPYGVEYIGFEAFSYCGQLCKIELPDSVKHIGNNAFLHTGFYNDLNNWTGRLLYLDSWLINADEGIVDAGIRPGTRGIASGAFIHCNNLTQIVVPESVMNIGDQAFNLCDNLKSVLILNKNCSIHDDKYTLGDPSFTTIIGYAGSTAEAFAKKYDFKFKNAKEISFIDVPENTYYAAPVEWAVMEGITNGTSANLFSPDTSCTRAQVVTFLWRAAGEPRPETKDNKFTDVKEGQYFYNAVLWAAENNITTGTTATTFAPEKTCTRAQIVTFLWRAENKPAPTKTDNPFKDVSVGQYYTDAVLWAVENEITKGTSADKFSPEDTCTRAQIVTFLYRAMA